MRGTLLIGAAFSAALLAFAAPASASLIASYNFNEVSGSIAHPTVGAIDGTLVGDASFVGGGVQGNAVSMTADGNGLVDFGTSLMPSNPFSVQIWVNTTSGSGAPLSYHTATVVAGFILGIGDIGDGCGGTAGTVSFYVAYPCSGHSVTAVNDGEWHQLVGVFTGSQTLVYVDGTLETGSPGGNPLNAAPANTVFSAGGVTVAGVPKASYNGLLDNLQLYDHALSGTEVLELYNSQVPVPATLSLIGAGLLALGLKRRA